MSTRSELSKQAARLFARNGYHGTSVKDLAVALGIQKSSVYSHIGGKEDLLAEIALEGASAFHAALDELPRDGTPLERLEAALAVHMRVVARQLDVATVWLQEWRYLTGAPRKLFLAERRRYEHRVHRLFEDAAQAGQLRPGLDLDRATLVFLSVGNWAYTWLAKGAEGEAEALWGILRDGLAG